MPQGQPRTPHHSRAPQATDAQCACAPIEDFTVSGKNTALQEVLGTGKYPHVKVLPFYELTRPRWRWHFGNCTHRPNGWKKYAGPPLKLRTARRDDRARLIVCDSRSAPRMRDQGDLLRLHALVLLAAAVGPGARATLRGGGTAIRLDIGVELYSFNPFPAPGISPPRALLARDRPVAPQAAPVVAR